MREKSIFNDPTSVLGTLVVFGFLGYSLFSAVVRGRLITHRGRSLTPAENPLSFWFLFLFYSAVLFVCSLGLGQELGILPNPLW